MRARLALLAALLCLSAGCRRSSAPPSPVLAEIRARFTRVVPETLPVPSEPALSAAVARAVDAVPGPMRRVSPTPAGAPTERLTVEIELGWQQEGQERGLRSVVRAHIRPLASVAPGGQGRAAGSGLAAVPGLASVDREALVEKEGGTAAPTAEEVSAHLDRALGLVVGATLRAAQLWLGPPSAARAALEGSDDELRDEAIRIAGERRNRESVPQLVGLLRHQEIEVRDRAIGALAEIGDPRAARPLADLAKFSEVIELPKILDAISRIGGPEAESFLDFVAAGHPIPQVREIAKRAREHASSHERAPEKAP